MVDFLNLLDYELFAELLRLFVSLSFNEAPSIRNAMKVKNVIPPGFQGSSRETLNACRLRTDIQLLLWVLVLIPGPGYVNVNLNLGTIRTFSPLVAICLHLVKCQELSRYAIESFSKVRGLHKSVVFVASNIVVYSPDNKFSVIFKSKNFY